MHNYCIIWEVQIQLSNNGSLYSDGYISGANERSNGQIIVCQGLSRKFSNHYIDIVRGSLSQGRGEYKVTPTLWAHMQY